MTGAAIGIVPRGAQEKYSFWLASIFGLRLDAKRPVLEDVLSVNSMKSFGGPEGIRTLDLFHAMEARSQLRHRPVRKGLTS